MTEGAAPAVEWICTTRRCFRPHGLQWMRPLLRLPLPRLTRDTWVRYRLPLNDLPPSPAGVSLTRVDPALMARLRGHPESGENQYQSALRFWDAGFGYGYLWEEGGEPLCLQWLIEARHLQVRHALGEWAGMYPEMEEGIGITEGLYTFRRGLRRRGGAATPMALAVSNAARQSGLKELRTHIHHTNLAAHRWAARVGWIPFGTVTRHAIDFRGLRSHLLYIHDQGPIPNLQSLPRWSSALMRDQQG